MEDFAEILRKRNEKMQELLVKWTDAKTSTARREVVKMLNEVLDSGVLASLKKRPDIRELLETHAKLAE